MKTFHDKARLAVKDVYESSDCQAWQTLLEPCNCCATSFVLLMHHHTNVITCYVEPPSLVAVCRLLHATCFRFNSNRRQYSNSQANIHSITVQMHSGFFSFFFSFAGASNSCWRMAVYSTLKHVSSENDLWSLIHCYITIICVFVIVVICIITEF